MCFIVVILDMLLCSCWLCCLQHIKMMLSEKNQFNCKIEKTISIKCKQCWQCSCIKCNIYVVCIRIVFIIVFRLVQSLGYIMFLTLANLHNLSYKLIHALRSKQHSHTIILKTKTAFRKVWRVH